MEGTARGGNRGGGMRLVAGREGGTQRNEMGFDAKNLLGKMKG